MMDNTSPSMGNAEKEERRRVFWSVYMLDRLASCARARPPAVLEASCHLSLPCDEELWRAEGASETPKLDGIVRGTIGPDQHPGFPALVMVMTSIVGRCVQCMLQDNQGGQRKPPWDPHSDHAAICSDLLGLEHYFDHPIGEALLRNCTIGGVQIDPGLAGPLIFSRTLFYLCHCLLSQPFLLHRLAELSQAKMPRPFLSRALDTGRDYARKLIRELHEAAQSGYCLSSSFYGYCIVIAGGIHAIHLSSTQDVVQEESRECLALCGQILGGLSQYWPSSVSMVKTYSPFPRKFVLNPTES
jgi:hypothetical protein